VEEHIICVEMLGFLSSKQPTRMAIALITSNAKRRSHYKR